MSQRHEWRHARERLRHEAANRVPLSLPACPCALLGQADFPRSPEFTREFPLEQAEGGFTSHHSFMVKYKAGQDLGLDMHTDDSDVTVNVCLGKDFRGAANQMRKTETAVCPDEHSRRHPIRCVRPSSTVLLRLRAPPTHAVLGVHGCGPHPSPARGPMTQAPR